MISSRHPRPNKTFRKKDSKLRKAVKKLLANLKLEYEKNPDSIEANRSLAEYYLDNAMEAEAETHLAKVLELDEQIAPVHNQLGVLYLRQSKYSEAEYHFKKALKFDLGMAEAHFNLAFLYQTQQKFREALVYFKEAVNLNPDDPEIYRLMGECARSAGMLQEAEAFFAESFRLHPNTDVAMDLSIIYINSGKYPKAEDLLKSLLNATYPNPDSDQQSTETAKQPDKDALKFALGLVLQKQGKYMDAIKQFHEVVTNDDKNEQAFNYLGECCASIGMIKEAESFFAKASKLKSQYLQPALNLGKLYYDQGRYYNTIPAMEQYVRIKSELGQAQEQDPETEFVYEILGRAYLQAGSVEKAMEVWKKSLEIDPDQPELKSLINDLSTPAYSKYKLNIGFVTYWFERGQAYVTQAIRNAAASIYNTFIFARNAGTAENPMLKTEGEWDVPNLTTHNEYQIPGEVLKKWIIDNKLDIVFFNEEYDFSLVETAKRCGVKTIGIYYWELFNPQFVPACNIVYDKIICPTAACYEKFKKLGLDNIEYVKWGINLEQFKHIDRPENERIRFFHPAGWGGMHARRGTQFVINAFQLMNAPDAELLIHIQTGSGIEEKGNIKVIHGTIPREELIRMYQGSDVAVLPSKWEGLGLTFLEAIGCGLPIITVNSPPMNEFVKDGVSGFCCKAGEIKEYPGIYVPGIHPDIRDMADKMNRIRDRKLLASMRRNTINAAGNWDWKENSGKIISIMEELKTGLKLNLGCGNDIRPGYVNIDSRALTGVDMIVISYTKL